jgi:hypothetical protein
MSAPQTDTENCVAHNGSLIPVPGRDIFVQAWYQGGVSVVDFTDSTNPVEIAFFDRGPLDEDELITAGYWSTYWYGGYIYGTEIARGLDVFALNPSDYLTANEIAAASLQEANLTVNAQTQVQVVWPAVPVVARAYIDQLQRSNVITNAQVQQLDSVLVEVERAFSSNSSERSLASQLNELAESLEEQGNDISGRSRARYLLLSQNLEEMARQLR